jgi:hypothetical protein
MSQIRASPVFQLGHVYVSPFRVKAVGMAQHHPVSPVLVSVCIAFLLVATVAATTIPRGALPAGQKGRMQAQAATDTRAFSAGLAGTLGGAQDGFRVVASTHAFWRQAAAHAPVAVRGLIPEEEASLELAKGLTDPPGAGHDAGRVWAEAATAWQARTLGFSLSGSVPLPHHALPSQAALALAERHGIWPTPQQGLSFVALDTLEAPARDSLTDLLDAYLSFDDATRNAYAHADLGDLHASLPPGPAGVRVLQQHGLDLGPVLAARNHLLEAEAGFSAAWGHRGATLALTLDLCPAFALDLAGAATMYSTNCAFILDAGGNDVYRNNAGGSKLTGSPSTCNILSTDNQWGAAAVVDLEGDDQYGQATSWCGINGGGVLGAGFLVDGEGDDTYTAGSNGVNGGGSLGAGFLLDQGGNDTYTATGAFSGSSSGANGGGDNGLGLLLDESGNDTYTATAAGSDGANGGSAFSGAGFLLDGGGRDAYTGGGFGSNGGGYSGGVGFLLDKGREDDRYDAPNGVGANGGGSLGTGFLMDEGGNDTYTGGGFGSNGGADNGLGALLDGGGRDTYTAGDYGTNGGGFDGVGLLVGYGGEDDAYTAGDRATNGGGFRGAGFLLDAGGIDTYHAGKCGVNGGANPGADCELLPVPEIGFGLLLDAAGTGDTYVDAESAPCNGSGTDLTLVPKCLLGAQVDL